MRDFTRGPYGEILPPPLVSGLEAEEAAEAMVKASQQTDRPITTIPTKGKARQGHLNQGLLFLHQRNLARALTGVNQEPDAVDLRRAVLDGEPLSLRPLGLEQLYFSSFAPVLQRLSDGRWQVGQPKQGRVKTFRADPAEVITQAQRLYVEWATDEAEQFKAWGQQAARQIKPAYQHLVWLADVMTTEHLSVTPTEGYTLQRLGKHSTYRLVTPKGWRIIKAHRPERAVAIMAAVLLQHQVALPAYDPAETLAALGALGGSLPQPNSRTRWEIGSLHGVTLTSNRIVLHNNGAGRYGLLIASNEVRLADLAKQTTLERLGVDPEWTPSASLLVGLTWAGWKMAGYV